MGSPLTVPTSVVYLACQLCENIPIMSRRKQCPENAYTYHKNCRGKHTATTIRHRPTTEEEHQNDCHHVSAQGKYHIFY